MIKIVCEGTIHRQDQIDILIEALYSRFRRYDYVIDTLIDEANKRTKDDDVSKWRDNLCDLCFVRPERIVNKVLETFMEEEGYGKLGDDWTYENMYRWDSPAKKIEQLLEDIRRFIWYDDDLMTDMFYSDSSTQADVNKNDWGEVKQLVKNINNYTKSYDSVLDKKDADLIKKHMSKKDITLYRIEPYENSYYKLNDLKPGSVFNLDFERTSGIKSFTSNINSKSMQRMIRTRRKENKSDSCIIYETIGPTYSLDIDAISGYAKFTDVPGCARAEYEHFVSGSFEVIDIVNEDGVIWVKIKQLSK